MRYIKFAYSLILTFTFFIAINSAAETPKPVYRQYLQIESSELISTFSEEFEKAGFRFVTEQRIKTLDGDIVDLSFEYTHSNPKIKITGVSVMRFLLKNDSKCMPCEYNMYVFGKNQNELEYSTEDYRDLITEMNAKRALFEIQAARKLAKFVVPD